MPDSLKKSYKTKLGRTVLSGGGVEPDIHIKDEPMSLIAVTLYTKNYLFDYATEYNRQHPTIALASKFSLTAAEFDQFAKWLENKDYSYETETEVGLDSLTRMAIKEKYYDDAKDEFDALKTNSPTTKNKTCSNIKNK